MALAAPVANNNNNSMGYQNNLDNTQGVTASGPQYIHNKSLFRNQNPADNQQDGFSLDSSMLGMNGPLSLSSIYSSEYGFILLGQYTQAFGQSNAASLEVDAGGRERRINGTWATAITSQQRLKFSAEYLKQEMDFGFLSGSLKKWVGQ